MSSPVPDSRSQHDTTAPNPPGRAVVDQRGRKGLDCFSKHRFATWNVLSLNGHGKCELLDRELRRLNIAIAGLQEVRLKGSGELSLTNYKILWSGHDSATQGVALAIRKDLVNCLSEWKPIGPRLMQTRFRHTRGYFTIFSCYAPTNAASDVEKDDFFSQLSIEVARTSQHDVVFVLGDLNATIGGNRQGYERVLGPCCSGPTNDNGYRTLDLAVTHDLRLAFSWFPHKDIHRITWYSNDGVTRKTIDHILFSKRWNAVSDCRAFRSAELGCTDHRIVVATVSLKLKRVQPNSTIPRLADVAKLVDHENSSVATNYSVAISNRFSALQFMEDLPIEESYEQFENALVSTALEIAGPKKKRRHAWISDESLQLVEECRRARMNGPQSDYRALRKLRRKSLRSDRRKWLEKMASKAEENFRRHKTSDLFKNIREICEQQASPSAPLRSTNGELTTDLTQKLHVWKEHYACQMNKSPAPSNSTLNNFAEAGSPSSDINTDPPTPHEIRSAIKSIPNGKSPGPDNITSEMLKAAIDSVVPALATLCCKIWDQETVPSRWTSGTIIPVFKNKGDRRLPSNYRPITLLSIPGKVIMTVIIRRILPHLLEHRRPEQSGFTPGRSTTECILALRVLAEKHREYRRPLFAAFVDLKTAFDSVDRNSLWMLLQGLGIPLKLITLIRSFHEATHANVRIEGRLSDPFPYTSGVRQGCVAAPNIFNVAIDHWMRKVNEMVPNLGVDYHGVVTDLCYADDVVIFASMLDIITHALNAMNTQAIPLGLQVNWAKTKIMANINNDDTPRTLTVDDNTIEVVDDFIYLGSKIGSSCLTPPEIRRRLALAHSAFGRMEAVWRRRAISLTLKLRLLDSLVLPVLLYGSETWTLSAESCNLVDAFHRKCLRRVLKIRWFHHITNDQLYALSNNPEKMSTIIRRSRMRLLGHISRLDERTPVRRILQAASSTQAPRGWRRPRGRPHLSWTSQVSATLPLQDAMRLAQDRRVFRELVATVT